MFWVLGLECVDERLFMAMACMKDGRVETTAPTGEMVGCL